MSRIELVNLRKEYGNVVAVKEMDLTIEDGEFIVFVGPSGCGKTTTLRMIAGFEDPTNGEILIDGEVVNEKEPGDRDLGMVFQSHALFPHKNVADNIAFGLRMQKVPQDEQARRVKEIAELVRITHLLGKMPGQCSGGESQRIALARTLVTEPSNFLLDEPLSSLDAKLRRELRAECDRLHDELQKTFIYVTHDQEEAMTLADRIIVMNQGKIVQQGTPLEIYGDPVSYFVADFFGNPAMNLIEGEFVKSGDGLEFKSGHFDVPLPAKFNAVAPGKGTFGIRPENVVIGASGQGATLEREVELVEPLGKDTLLYFETEQSRPFVSVVEGTEDVKRHANVTLSFPDDAIFLFAADGDRIR
ncbi:MAG: ABC transporter ATP-binding protein [Alphaproteobacteria bacterium]|nr:ABC transporter ATP-binding protein [Alphaproteobacteria bacterium]